MKLYLDEHVQPLLAHILTSRGIDCLTTQAAGNLSHSDDDQLVFATNQERVIVTFDRKYFRSLAQQWATENRTHAGIILSKPCALSELLRQLLHLIARHHTDNLANQVLWLQNYKDPHLP